MSKLRLSLDSLEVTSFEIAREGAARGTVQGQSVIPISEVEDCGGESISQDRRCACTGPTCDYTLVISCVPDNCMSGDQIC